MTRSWKQIPLSLLCILGTSLIGCSKSDNPINSNPTDAYLWVYYRGDSVRVGFEGLPTFDAEGVEAIQLDQFVDTSLIPPFNSGGNLYESRRLFSYQIVGDDGYSASGTKGHPNNIWHHLTLGHLLTASRQVVFPDDKIDLLGAYNVKGARSIYLHRKIDIQLPDTLIFIELRFLNTTQVENADAQLEAAVALKDLIEQAVTDPTAHTYNLRSLDDRTLPTDLTWQQIQTGYWLLESQRTRFLDPSLQTGSYRLKALEAIRVL